MLTPNSPRWNTVIQCLLTRVAPPVVAATVLLTATPGSSPAQSGWKWGRPHASPAVPAPAPKNGFATSVTRLMEQARREAEQGQLDAAVQTAERAQKLADAAQGVLGPHADCSPEAARQLVQDLQVLQAHQGGSPVAMPQRQIATTTPSVTPAPVKVALTKPAPAPGVSVPVRPQPVKPPVNLVQRPTPAVRTQYPQPPVIERPEQRERPAIAATVPQAPTYTPYVAPPLTPAPASAQALPMAVAVGAANAVSGAPIALRRQYETTHPVISAEHTTMQPHSTPTQQSYLPFGGFAIVDGDQGGSALLDNAAAPALPDHAVASPLTASAPAFPEDAPLTTLAMSPYVATFSESMTLDDEPAQPELAEASLPDDPMGLVFAMDDTEPSKANVIQVPELAQAAEAPAEADNWDFPVVTVARSYEQPVPAAVNDSLAIEPDETFVAPQPLVTEVLPLVETEPVATPQPATKQPQTVDLAHKPQPTRTPASPVTDSENQQAVIDASLMEWSSANGGRKPISRTRHEEVESAWEPVRPQSAPVNTSQEPDYEAPITDPSSAQTSQKSASVVVAYSPTANSGSSVITTGMTVTANSALPVVVTPLDGSQPAPTVAPKPAVVVPDELMLPTGPTAWMQTVSSPTETAAQSVAVSRSETLSTSLIHHLSQTWKVPPRVVGLIFAGGGLLLCGAGLMLFRGSRTEERA
ncbi:hypothetical protein GC163_11590 [bacterium]|nr:hypothetical protein [bacterium]